MFFGFPYLSRWRGCESDHRDCCTYHAQDLEEEFCSPLWAAAKLGYTDNIKCLLEHEANPNKAKQVRSTLLLE